MDRRSLLGGILCSLFAWLLPKAHNSGIIDGGLGYDVRSKKWRQKTPHKPTQLPDRVIHCDLLEIINKDYYYCGFPTITKIDGKDVLREITIHLQMNMKETKCTVLNSIKVSNAIENVVIYPKRLRLDCGNLTIRQHTIPWAEIDIGGIKCHAISLDIFFTEGEIVTCNIVHAIQPLKVQHGQ